MSEHHADEDSVTLRKIQWCQLHLGPCTTVHAFSRGHPMASESAMLICTHCLWILKKESVVTKQTHALHGDSHDYWQLTPVAPTHRSVQWHFEDKRRPKRSSKQTVMYELELDEEQAIVLRAHGYTLLRQL